MLIRIKIHDKLQCWPRKPRILIAKVRILIAWLQFENGEDPWLLHGKAERIHLPFIFMLDEEATVLEMTPKLGH